MKKLFVTIITLFLISCLALAGCGQNTQDSSSGKTGSNSENSGSAQKTFKIGISQYVEHPALDSAREGFIDGLKEAGFEEGKNILIEIENAQADFATALSIANKFVSDKMDLILAIATPSAQSAAKVTKEIPIVITAVTDPVAAELVKSLENPGTNVTGTTDMNPIKEQLALLKEILHEAKEVGILYNASEANSVVQVEIAKNAAQELGLNIVEDTVSNTSEVNQVAQSIAPRVDAFYIPTDNTVASAIGAVVKVCIDEKIPIIGSERGHVEGGALATLGIDYYLLGKQSGAIAARILNGEDPASIPIEGSKDLKLTINKGTAEALGINIPNSVMERVDEVIEK